MARPAPGTYPQNFNGYISRVTEDDLSAAFKNQWPVVDDFFDNIAEEQTNKGYAPGKWSLKEMLQHIIDAERIFSYRALCFARNEKTSLPSFDEDAYAANSAANARSWKSLCEEFKMVRLASEMMFGSFSAEVLGRMGIANNSPASVLSMGFTAVGHLAHHVQVIKERYLPADLSKNQV